MAVLVGYFCGVKGLHRECWPAEGFSCAHVTRARVCQYVKIYLPAAIVGASDWWRVAAIGAVAVTLGEKELAVFNSSYRVLWMANMFNGSLSGAMAVKLGIALGQGDAAGARRICAVSTALVLGICGGGGLLVFASAPARGAQDRAGPDAMGLVNFGLEISSF